ncbi:MAG: STAS domain-containing protein [Thermodesulfobacteriota bacterium]
MELRILRADDEVTHLALAGRLDMVGVHEIRERFNRETVGRGRPVVLDLSEVTFTASLGIEMLILTSKALGALGVGMVALRPQEMVEKVLRITGIEEIIPITRDPDEALKLAVRC